MKLVVATPSPFARTARIALLEKNLPHEVIVQNPWQTRIAGNPLGKVPALLLDDGRVVHDSSVILEYLETLDAPPRLIPAHPAQRVQHKQVEAVADGICDAVVLIVTERARPPEKQSAEWIARQAAKLPPSLDFLAQEVACSAGFGLRELATGCALGYLDLRYPELDWRAAHPGLRSFFEDVSARPSFAATPPKVQPIP